MLPVLANYQLPAVPSAEGKATMVGSLWWVPHGDSEGRV